MKRLVDELSDEGAEGNAKRLLSAMQPLERSQQRRAEGWQRLLATSTAPRARRRRAYVVGPLVVLAGALAFAAQQGRDDASELDTARAKPQSTEGHETTAVVQGPQTTPERARAGNVEAVPAASERPAPEEQGTTETRATSSTKSGGRSVASESKAAPLTEEARLLLSAMRARREGDEARALELSRRYRASYPEGALAEEALAVSIESALAQRDQEAAALGRRYLQKYPTGRYRALAQRAAREDQKGAARASSGTRQK